MFDVLLMIFETINGLEISLTPGATLLVVPNPTTGTS
jgi:hypothetical protein